GFLGHRSTMNPGDHLVRLRQGNRPIEDYVEDFCALCYKVDFNETFLKDIFRYGLSKDFSSFMPRNTPHWTLEQYIDFALRLAGSPFTVGVAVEEPCYPPVSAKPGNFSVMSGVIQVASEPSHAMPAKSKPAHVMTTKPQSTRIMPAKPKPAQVISTKPEPSHVTSAKPLPGRITSSKPQPAHVTSSKPQPAAPGPAHAMAARPEPAPVMAARPEPAPVMAARPEPAPVMAALPQPAHKMAAIPEPVHKMAAIPEPVHKMAAIPKPVHKMAAIPKPVHKMAAIPKPVHKMAAPSESPAKMAATPEPHQVKIISPKSHLAMSAAPKANQVMPDPPVSSQVRATLSVPSQDTAVLHESSQDTAVVLHELSQDTAVVLHESSQDTAAVLHESSQDTAVVLHESSQVTAVSHESSQVTAVPHESSQVTAVPHESSQVTAVPHESSQVTAVPHESSHVVPESSHVVPESSHVVPESSHVSKSSQVAAASPESSQVSKSSQVTAVVPESSQATAAVPVSSQAAAVVPASSQVKAVFPVSSQVRAALPNKAIAVALNLANHYRSLTAKPNHIDLLPEPSQATAILHDSFKLLLLFPSQVKPQLTFMNQVRATAVSFSLIMYPTDPSHAGPRFPHAGHAPMPTHGPRSQSHAGPTLPKPQVHSIHTRKVNRLTPLSTVLPVLAVAIFMCGLHTGAREPHRPRICSQKPSSVPRVCSRGLVCPRICSEASSIHESTKGGWHPILISLPCLTISLRQCPRRWWLWLQTRLWGRRPPMNPLPVMVTGKKGLSRKTLPLAHHVTIKKARNELSAVIHGQGNVVRETHCSAVESLAPTVDFSAPVPALPALPAPACSVPASPWLPVLPALPTSQGFLSCLLCMPRHGLPALHAPGLAATCLLPAMAASLLPRLGYRLSLLSLLPVSTVLPLLHGPGPPVFHLLPLLHGAQVPQRAHCLPLIHSPGPTSAHCPASATAPWPVLQCFTVCPLRHSPRSYQYFTVCPCSTIQAPLLYRDLASRPPPVLPLFPPPVLTVVVLSARSPLPRGGFCNATPSQEPLTYD
ncbi:hypothetical protein M9458_055126, partial [Cirrhinus mrigala]